MNHLLLGGGGFIGLRLASKLSRVSKRVVIVDRNREYFEKNRSNTPSKIEFFKMDLNGANFPSELATKLDSVVDPWVVWLLAANSDIQKSSRDARVDYQDTLGTTISAMELCATIPVSQIVFASSSAVYGDQPEIRLTEDFEIRNPVSNYGTMKLASEQVLWHHFTIKNIKTTIYRFPNVIGWPCTHGVIFDFIRKLKKDNSRLEVLGNGFQTKPYIHADDLADIMINLLATAKMYDVFNIGPLDTGITVREIAENVVLKVSPEAKIIYEETLVGWPGDVQSYSFDVSKMLSAIPNFKLTSKEALAKTIEEL